LLQYKLSMKFEKAGNFLLGRIEYGGGNKENVYAPRSGELISELCLSTENDLVEYLPEIKKAQLEWGSLTYKKRAEVIFNFRSNLEKYRSELVELIVAENGKTVEEADAEVNKAIELCEFAVGIPSIISGRTQVVSGGIEVKEVIEPVGIVASITPFNFPLMVPMWTIPTTIVLGNAMIVKPSEKTPLTILKIASILKESGCPDGIFNVIQGDKEMVKVLCEHPSVEAITFVGSTPIAKRVYQLATASLKRCLALGGAKNHIVVTEEVEAKLIASEIVSAAFGMSGQRCMAASVLLLVGNCEHIMNELVKQTKELVCGKEICPLITGEAVKEIEDYLNMTAGEMIVDGRTAKSIGDKNGYYIGPSIVKYDAYKDMAEEEVFGPVLELVCCETLEEALNFQKESPYANGATIFTENGRFAQEAVNHFTSGMIGVNIGIPVPRDPFSFGGLKQSKFGVGDITGYNSIAFLTNSKKVTTKWNPKDKKDWMS